MHLPNMVGEEADMTRTRAFFLQGLGFRASAFCALKYPCSVLLRAAPVDVALNPKPTTGTLLLTLQVTLETLPGTLFTYSCMGLYLLLQGYAY